MKRTIIKTEREDWLFLVAGSVIFFSALTVTAWDFVQIQKMVYRLGTANAMGLGFFSIGVSIRIVARRTLGKHFSSGLKMSQEQELIEHGIYRHVRHPAYLGSLLLSPGIPLIFSSLYGLLLMLGLVPCFVYRIRIEERMLLKRFGERYRQYMKKTKKIIPYVY